MSDFVASLRYPDPAIEVLDERFLQLRLFSAHVERIATGLRWAEGPVWFGDGRYLLVSDIPNNRVIRWDDVSDEEGTGKSPCRARHVGRARGDVPRRHGPRRRRHPGQDRC